MSRNKSEDCVEEGTLELSDKDWYKSLDDKESKWLKDNVISFEELEDRKVVCSACFKQENHKKKVSIG